MGVERFFSSLSRDFNIIQNTKYPYKKINCSHFMLDFNSIVYIPQQYMAEYINNYISKNKNKTELEITNKFETELLRLVEKYTLDLLKDNIVSDSLEYFFIYIDGVPTMAKIYEQKKRIFMGALQSNLTKHIQKDYSWSSSSNIKPGTNFMSKLEKLLNSSSFRTKIKDICKNLKGYILSDSSGPGEAEMKILNCIRTIKNSGNICVYSPDSDMIILLMLVENPLILLRYDQQKGTLDNKLFNILNINNFKKLLLKYCKNRINIKINEKNLIDDIIFIFTIFGDDFLPKLETFRIDKDLYIILDYYLINLVKYGYLIDFDKIYKINTKNYAQYLKRLQRNENSFLYRNYQINKFSNFYRIDTDLFINELLKIKKELDKYNKNEKFSNIKNNKNPYIYKIFNTNEFYLNLLKYLDSDSLRKYVIKYGFGNDNMNRYYNLFHHFETTEDLIFYISIYYNNTSKLPFNLNIKYNTTNFKLQEIRYSSDDIPHVYKLKNLDEDEKLNYMISKKLDKYYNLFNPKDEFYHKYFNTYNSNLNDVTINSYYKLYFHNFTIEKVLKEYFTGLNWVVNYYFNNITDNNWYYPFAKSPLLYNIVNQYSNFSSLLTKINSNNFLITQLEQFLFIKTIDINKDIIPQLKSLTNIFGSSDLNKIAKFVLNNKKYFYNLSKLFDNLFNHKEKIMDCTSSVFINKCHLLILEGYIDIKEFATEFRKYLPLEYQRKYYPNVDKLICVN